MYHPGQHQPLARLRPEKLDDAEIQKQISLIQQACGDIDPDLIAVVFHECDYHLQNTITRIKSGDFQDSGWQTAKSNTKKKLPTPTVNPSNETLSNGDSFRRTRPTTSRSFVPRRGNSSQQRFPGRSPALSETSVPTTTTTTGTTVVAAAAAAITGGEEIESTTDQLEFLENATQTLSLENPSTKKISFPSTTKRPLPSSIPPQPVAMHPTVQLASEPFDIQFGDVTWKDSIPSTISPVEHLTTSNSVDDEQNSQQIETKEFDSSVPMSHSTLTNHVSVTSHLSDHLNESSQAEQVQQNEYQHQQSNDEDRNVSSHLPSTSTPHPSEYSSATNNPNVHIHHGLNGNPSAFTPYNTTNPTGVYSSIPRDYSQTGTSWSTATTGNNNYKPVSTTTTTTSSVTNYSPHQATSAYQWTGQPPYLISTYPYAAPQVYQIIPAVDAWPSGTFQSSIDPYATYPNYVAAYQPHQQYHPTTKYNAYPSHEKEYYHNYGQTRTSNHDLSSNSQQNKDPSTTSKLSAAAATFSQAAPLTATSPTGAFLINPVSIPMQTYWPSHPDRTITYPSLDSRDNRNGAPYGSQNNRNYYQQPQQQPQQQHQQHQQQQQQRLNSNPTWHSQQ